MNHGTVNPQAMVNNPFTGEMDEESVTPSPEKLKRFSQMQSLQVSTKPLIGPTTDEIQLRGFDKFVKLVQLEEKMYHRELDQFSMSEVSSD